MRGRRIVAVVAVGMLALTSVLGLIAWLGLRASLPTVDGNIRVSDLQAAVTIERDAAGVPTLSAGNRNDLARALGFVHGQDRFFQMDLLRRAAAGELSGLLGPALLPTDRRLRIHRLRPVARAVVDALTPANRSLLEAYAAGVNAGVASLSARPFEYWLLRGRPRAWTAEDSILCVHAMYLELQDAEGHSQLQRGFLRAALPPAAWQFLEAGAPEWEAAVDGTVDLEPQIPREDQYDLRALGLPQTPASLVDEQGSMLGSNNWAVSGRRTATGAALVANDMHLDYRVPNIWYRARLIAGTGADAIDVSGVTLPGTPSVVAGSNGSIAWGFTNSYGEFSTVVRLVAVENDATAYRTASGTEKLTFVDEPIEVAGGPTDHLTVALSRWGPVMGTDWHGAPYALQWTAHDPAATNLDLLGLADAHSVDEALALAPGFGMPGQNLMVADRAGHIGWTIAGRLPVRRVSSDDTPQESTDAQVGYAGWLQPRDQPRVIDPAAGFLWSANARVVGGAAATLIGDDGMDRGARARQIRSDLQNAALPFTTASSLAIQLDARAVFLQHWKELLGDLLARTTASGNHAHAETMQVLRGWSGQAIPQDAAYRLVYAFRREVATRTFMMLVAPARSQDPQFKLSVPSSFEGPLWRLLNAKPQYLLAADYASWDELLLAALSDSEKLPAACSDLASCTWGRVNTVRVSHPLSSALPWLASFLDMPTTVVAGGREDMPRIQGPDFGASERFSVSPGDEARGYFHMPGAQSGHPLSPFIVPDSTIGRGPNLRPSYPAQRATGWC